MGIYTDYKQDEKSCLRSHKTAKNIVISLKNLPAKREASGSFELCSSELQDWAYSLQTKQ